VRIPPGVSQADFQAALQQQFTNLVVLPDKWLATETTSEHHVTEHAVMASEIEQLPDLVGFLKLASSRSWRRVQIQRLKDFDRI
jgi:hypothetical protein